MVSMVPKIAVAREGHPRTPSRRTDPTGRFRTKRIAGIPPRVTAAPIARASGGSPLFRSRSPVPAERTRPRSRNEPGTGGFAGIATRTNS